jgi:protein phosphatase 2C family protein 2/3
MDMDMMDHRGRSFGGFGGHPILLPDVAEPNANDADAEMFDHDDEDHDLNNQVHKTVSSDEEEEGESEVRKQREGTPGPTSAPAATEKAAEAATESPSSVATERSETPAPGEPAKTTEAPAPSKPAEENTPGKA